MELRPASANRSMLPQSLIETIARELHDILRELRKPGRDPRDRFEPPAFREDVREPADLFEGMELEGIVTNIVAFGAFVDIGVHQDGLVHISQIADRYVRDASEVLSVGQRVRVRVLSVEPSRNRIALTMRQPRAGDERPIGQSAEERALEKTNGANKNLRRGDVAPNGFRFR